MLKLVLLIAALLIPAFSFTITAQECRPPAIVANTGAGNMFKPDQEMTLGELTLLRLARDFREFNDPALRKYLDDLGQRIVRHLPETGLRFTFHIIEYPEANAFNIPGGHVFVSRKLIALAKNEDELAGVIGHELGHATVHHGALDMSNLMRQILSITALGDRKDILEKYNLLLENSRTKRVKQKADHEGAQQVEADRIGLFAMVAAGYDPDAFFTFFDRLTESEGKTGGWFSDFFGKTKPAQKRLREMKVLMEKMDTACRDPKRDTLSDFSQWQADVVMYRESGRKEELPGLVWKKDLQSKLRSDINHLAFSPNGKMLLAQDEFGITVIDVEAKKAMFQIPVKDPRDAIFTADNKYLIFETGNLRFEKWDIATQKPVAAREMVVYYDCAEHKISPDGNYFACVDQAGRARLIDVKTGEKVWEKEDFYIFEYFEYLIFNGYFGLPDLDEQFFNIEFSPDAKYVVFSRTLKGRFSATEGNEMTAVGIPAFKRVNTGGNLKQITARGYAFLDSGRVVGLPSRDLKEAGVFSFPEGKRLQQFTLGGSELRRTENPDYVIVKPTVETKMGIFDAKRGTMLAGLNKEDATLWGNLIAFETAAGKIVIRELTGGKALDGKDIATIDIPITSIGNLRAASISNSFNWIALSAKTRGGMWNLATGEQKILVRGFNGAVVADDGGAIGYFPKMFGMATALALLNPLTGEVTALRDMPERGSQQYGRFVLVRSSLKDDKPDPDDEKKKIIIGGQEIDRAPVPLYYKVKFELKDVVNDQVIWSRDFPKAAPAYTFDQSSGRLMFFWGVRTDAGKARLEESPEMKPKVAALGDKDGDYLVEIVDAYAKKTVGLMLIETGKGSFSLRYGLSAGDWVVFYDSSERVLAYSIKEGTLKHRFFGSYAVVNPRRNELAVENFPGEIHLYDLTTGESRAKLVFDGDVAFARYNLEGTRFFVLNDLQTAYLFDVDKAGTGAAAKPVF